jgi:uncharacterized protein with von Willebrand factor type A (vWA) domain
MFINFFYELKSQGVPVSLNEWMTLMEALDKGLSFSSLTGFYFLARAILVKSEAHFDKYDLAFAQYFNGVETPEDIFEKAEEWLNMKEMPALLSPEKKPHLSQSEVIELRRMLEARIKEKEQGKHQQGPSFGAEGTSPFGNAGGNPMGIRIGGESISHSAVKVAAKRSYRSFRDDHIKGVRQFEMALRRLRQLSTRVEGPKDELDIDGTIDATCRNAGMLQLVWDRPRRNTFKIILLMDSGGSIDRYREICSRLFTAANRATHFKEVKYYYFHNCVYENIFTDYQLSENKAVKTEDFLKQLKSDYRLIMIGDAAMAPSELTMVGGGISWNEYNKEPGQDWLKRLARHFPYTVWLNPVPKANWRREPDFISIPMVQEIFSMFELTPGGLEQAIKRLRRKTI